MEFYSHIQPAKLILSAMGAMGVLLVAVLIVEPNSIGIAALGVLIVAAWMFSRLTIEVTENELKWRFGPGWLKKKVPLDSIGSCEPMRYPWWYGYGIRLTPHGWLYNVSGNDAVCVRLKTGKTFLLGTDDHENLQRAIEQGIQQATSNS